MSTYSYLASSGFLSAIAAIYGYSYLSSTTTAAATASLSSGATTAAAYSAATSSASVSTAAAAIDVRRINAALYCAYLAAATNGSTAGSALCLAPTSPPPPPSAPSTMDYTWLAPLVLCSLFGILLFALAAVYVAKLRQAEGLQGRPGGVHMSTSAPAWSGLALKQQSLRDAGDAKLKALGAGRAAPLTFI